MKAGPQQNVYPVVIAVPVSRLSKLQRRKLNAQVCWTASACDLGFMIARAFLQWLRLLSPIYQSKTVSSFRSQGPFVGPLVFARVQALLVGMYVQVSSPAGNRHAQRGKAPENTSPALGCFAALRALWSAFDSLSSPFHHYFSCCHFFFTVPPQPRGILGGHETMKLQYPRGSAPAFHVAKGCKHRKKQD